MSWVQLRNITLGRGRPKVIVPITGRTLTDLLTEADSLAEVDLDIVEWRADFLEAPLSPAEFLAVAAPLRAAVGERPLLFTFRTPSEGGERAISPQQYRDLGVALVESGLVDAIDVEHRFERAAGDAVLAAAGKAKVPALGSFHDFSATPSASDLVELMVAMQRRGCAVAKAAVMPHTPGDVLALMSATWTMTTEHPSTPVLTMAMGGLGVLSRLSPRITGSCATFASVGRASAPGQLPLDELRPVLQLIEAQLPSPAVALIGLPGSGKSTVGPLLAERLGVPHLDVDQVLEQRQGRSIREIFTTDGEPSFRRLERDLSLELLTTPGVLSLGGGAPMTPEVAAALAQHHVIWLRVDPRTAAARVHGDTARPLLTGTDPSARLTALHESRAATYARLATTSVAVDSLSPEEVVATILTQLPGAG